MVLPIPKTKLTCCFFSKGIAKVKDPKKTSIALMSCSKGELSPCIMNLMMKQCREQPNGIVKE